ncbi:MULTISPECIES: hypothetical protein [unclassified Streptomyces]|uniref:hypothetical protein n=1 Tax=unclassified Streptomyces TaxID=2593676 RepID=UPI00093D0CDB|nr:hypothetical protein [Streptomyces sp. TSRI0281]OKI46871.1 hypothetical protein A6A29_25305 [Streptomyces sp. TSRI0281]
MVTARSIEFDAVLLAVAPGARADARGARDARAKAGEAGAAEADPRVVLLVAEAFRHGKVIGSWGDADEILRAASVPAHAPGVVTGASADVLSQLAQLLGKHRVWERFPAAAV